MNYVIIIWFRRTWFRLTFYSFGGSMRFLKYVFIFSLLTLILSCTTRTENGETVLEGKVYYLDKNYLATPIPGALVNAKNMFSQTLTDATGAFRLIVNLEASEDQKEVQLEISKVGFNTNSLNVQVKRGATITVSDITLIKVGGDSTVAPTDTISSSGPASHIEISGKHDTHLYIQSSGLKEATFLNFAVTDDKGVLVDEDHKVTVHFSILNGPGGGEYLYPETMDTQGGYAYTVLNSGILAGAVQIDAWADVDGKTIRTMPVRIAIYGGLPDADHFSLAMEKVNIAGRVHFGIIDKVTAFVGDKFSNPVAPGTAVYFSSDYGIVEGSAVTDIMGRAVVRFMSADPLPPTDHSFATVTAVTYSDTLGSKTITTQNDILLSAITKSIFVSPTTFTYNNTNTPVHFNYTVSDIYDYPIVSSSIINVEATDGNLFGDINVRQVDTQASGPGTTDFSFTWAPGDSLDAPLVNISITVSPPEDGNGYRSVTITGTKQ